MLSGLLGCLTFLCSSLQRKLKKKVSKRLETVEAEYAETKKELATKTSDLEKLRKDLKSAVARADAIGSAHDAQVNTKP